MKIIRTDEVYLDNTNSKMEEALQAADEFIEETKLSKRDGLHLRLLVEEVLGMVRAMTGDFTAVFDMEYSNYQCKIRLVAQTIMDKEKKQELLSLSTSGKNASAKGFMAKIGEIIENGFLDYSEVARLQQEYGGNSLNYGFMGMDSIGAVDYACQWSLGNYRSALKDEMEENAPAKEAYDELERSIVASLAEDVIVGVKKDKVEVTVIMNI